MNGNVKNFLVLGFALIFILFFFALVEINRGQQLINSAENPQKSIDRGFDDAESEFSSGIAYYHRFNGKYLGVEDKDLESLNRSLHRFSRWVCTVNAYSKPLGLKIEDYEYNQHYVLAYNTRLRTLAGSSIGSDFDEIVNWLTEVNPTGFFPKSASYSDLGKVCNERKCFRLILASYVEASMSDRHAIAVLTFENVFLGSYFPFTRKPSRISSNSLIFSGDSIETEVSLSGLQPPMNIQLDGKLVQFHEYP